MRDKPYQRLLDRDSREVPPVLREYSEAGEDCSPIAATRYTDPCFFELERRHLWPHVWQVACREEDIPETGDIHVYEIADRSFLIVRTGAGQIRAYYNSCLHRGRKLMDASGRVEQLRCGFHGWTWNLDGEIKSLPCRSEFAHLDDGGLALPQVLVSCWGGFVFINMDLKAPPLEEFLGVLPEHFSRWKLEECYKAVHVGRVIRCNWKVAQEAFMESYHVVATHPQILSFFDDVGAQYDVFGEHVNRNLAAFAEPSPHLAHEAGVHEVIEGMFGLWGREDAAAPRGDIGEGGARAYLGGLARAALQRTSATDLGPGSDAEMLDALVYNLFPNFAPWGGFAPNIVYRWRPNGCDVDSCIMEVMILKRPPRDGRRPEPAALHWLSEDEPWSAASELHALGPVIDQDMSNMPQVQEGLKASVSGEVQLGRYVESRIRHFHRTLDAYIERGENRAGSAP
jgi:nitrite reductase/ring-hydroxylating ferredoxin subunit